jgi:hypothetical protein
MDHVTVVLDDPVTVAVNFSPRSTKVSDDDVARDIVAALLTVIVVDALELPPGPVAVSV